jgi:ketosteroid isomerase-like protein
MFTPAHVVRDFYDHLARGDFAAKAHEFIADGNRVVALGTYSGTYKATGKSTTADFANIWTVRANKLQTFHMHTDTAKVLEAMTK